MHLKLPRTTLKFRRMRGDMIKAFKLIYIIYDESVSLQLFFCTRSNITLKAIISLRLTATFLQHLLLIMEQFANFGCKC